MCIADNLAQILAIELMAAGGVAIDQMRPLMTTPEPEKQHARLRETVAPHEGDRRMDRDIEKLANAINHELVPV